ncbi:hypothetical protein [Candidatus Magnetobacterium casense]|uniref:Uncharacterized protein n=1 Tax=Candidatus Magnetobacterium casense TaxID=1455061 RepID=A0ABS6S4L7_9BACT|nr:hypothetical protein [Candidatus Magnetobacterium casensis]MBV6343338.1 hypothetical protein [Candidatus Magnetobacterium casensis]
MSEGKEKIPERLYPETFPGEAKINFVIEQEIHPATKEFWIGWCPSTGKMTHRHDSYNEALLATEAEARQAYSGRFFVLQAVSVVTAESRTETQVTNKRLNERAIEKEENHG